MTQRNNLRNESSNRLSPSGSAKNSQGNGTDDHLHRWYFIAAMIVVAIGGIVRYQASLDNFWLDEIWSWQFAASAKSFWQIATQMPHDNNHILNTWVMYALTYEAHWTSYRIPAVLAGIGTVALAGASGFRRSRAEGLFALLLTGSSFVLIQYSSEARGYAYLLFFTMLCIWTLEQTDVRKRSRLEWIFGISELLGFLGHFLFAAPFAGFVIWSAVIAFREKANWKTRLHYFLHLHSLPISLVATLVYCYGKRPITGGGDRNPLWQVLVETCSLAVGGPSSGTLAVACSVAVFACLVAGILILRRQRDDFWIFVAASISTLSLMIAVTGFDTIYPRHFLVPLLCFLLITSHLLAKIWNQGRFGMSVSVVVVATLLIANGAHTHQLLKYGRGGYQDAISYLLQHTESPVATVGSDHDFRNSTMLNYYWLMQSNPKRIEYVGRGQWPREGPEWFIRHSFEQPVHPEADVTIADIPYHLVRTYPYSGLSGWNWMLYHRVQKSPPPKGS